VLRILRSLTLRPGLLERGRLLVCLLEYFAARGRTIVHVGESSVNQFLRDDLISICRLQPRLRLVFSVLPDVDQTYLLGHQSGIRIDVPQFEAAQLQRVLRGKFGGNEVPEWLPRMLSQQTCGSRGLTALRLIELFQDDRLRWDTDDCWCAGEPVQSGAVPVGLSRLLQPLESVFRETPHLESLLRLAALCGELIPMTLLLDFLRIPEAERDELLDVIDERLCDGVDCVPILADLGYGHPGFCMNRKINVYQFRCSLDAELLVCGTSAEWRQQQAEALLKYLERAEPECSRGLASLYLHLHEYLPDGRVQCEALRQRLQWWIHDIEEDLFRDHIAKSINSRRLSGEAVWLAIQRSGGEESAALRLNLLLAYEQQRDGVPVANQVSFLEKKGLLLKELARYDEAEVCLRKGLRICEQTEDPDHPDVARCLENLALLLIATNRVLEGEPLYRRALAIFESSYGPDHPEVAIRLNNLARLLRGTNRLLEAEPLSRRALAISESSCGPDHPQVAGCLNNLAGLLYSTNGMSEAEPMYRRSLAISESVYGPDHPVVATCLYNLASLLSGTNRLSEAEPMYRRSLAISESVYGPDHPNVARCLNNLAELLRDTNRLLEAEPLYRRSLAISESSHGPDHPAVAILLNNLAELLRDTNRLLEAEPMYRRSLAISESVYGPDHPDVATYLNNLANLLRGTNRLLDAEPLYRRSLSILESSSGPDHPDVARCLNNLAELLSGTNRILEAEPLYRRSLAISESVYGPDHPDVATYLHNLANLLRGAKRLLEAEPMYCRSLSIFESSYGPDHPDVARCLNNFGELLSATNRMSEAERSYRRSLSIFESSYGPDHPDVASCLNNLAELLSGTNRMSEAEPMSSRAVSILVRFQVETGHEHPNFARFMNTYEKLLVELGHDAAAMESRLRVLLQPLNPE
jgi:tetratricopeptide (TPR) repeat protein